MSFENGVSDRQKPPLDSEAQLFTGLKGKASGCVGVLCAQINEEYPAKESGYRQVAGTAIHSATGTGSKCHTSPAYSLMVRSDENLPQRAMLRMAMEAQLDG